MANKKYNLAPDTNTKMQLRKFGSNGNEQIKCQNELCSIFKSLNSGFKQDCFA